MRVSRKTALGKYRWAYGFFEPLTFHKRSGMWVNPPPRDLQEWYERGHSEETAKALAELGVNIITTRFYKGFGLQAEEEDIESGKRFITHCHKYGIKALVYIQFRTIMFETIQKEIPNARDWANRDPEGKVVTWEQRWYWRWITCPTNGDFIAYLKKAMRKALTEADADGIWLDNFSWDPNGCYCQRCKETFRRYESVPSLVGSKRRFVRPTR